MRNYKPKGKLEMEYRATYKEVGSLLAKCKVALRRGQFDSARSNISEANDAVSLFIRNYANKINPYYEKKIFGLWADIEGTERELQIQSAKGLR